MNGSNPAAEHGTDLTCEQVAEQVYAFIDNELDTASGEAIRAHLVACEPCLDRFDVEQAVKKLVHRCCGGDRAPDHLRVRVMTQLTVTRVDYR